jgi:hypothetical protein
MGKDRRKEIGQIWDPKQVMSCLEHFVCIEITIHHVSAVQIREKRRVRGLQTR